MNKKWEDVQDNHVRTVWVCEEENCDCGNHEVYLFPCDIINTGIPICPETGNDLTYLKTEIKIINP